MDNTNKIVKPNLKKKSTVAEPKTTAAVKETSEAVKRVPAEHKRIPAELGNAKAVDKSNRVENLSILEQAKQQNEVEQKQLKEMLKQKQKKTKQITIASCIGVGLVLAVGISIIAITKNKTTDKDIGRNTVEVGTVGVNPVTGDPISREQAEEYKEEIKDTNRSEAELFYNSSNSTSIDKEQYISLYSYYRNNGYNTSDTNKLVDKYFKDNKEYKGTDDENKKADNVASDNNIKSDWGNTTGTINSKDTSTSNGVDISGSTKTFKPSDELRKYNEEASKANEKAE